MYYGLLVLAVLAFAILFFIPWFSIVFIGSLVGWVFVRRMLRKDTETKERNRPLPCLDFPQDSPNTPIVQRK
jgi:hypothetical protein